MRGSSLSTLGFGCALNENSQSEHTVRGSENSESNLAQDNGCTPALPALSAIVDD
jgi:hypothetical protein